eukprot:scaffold2962_cov126-Cylindrotheca_fusiformis.AAC.11
MADLHFTMIFKTLILPLLAMVGFSNAQNSIAGTLNSNPDLSKFIFYLNTIGLSPGDADMVFAPTNEAWDALQQPDHPNYEVWQKYTTQPEFIIQLVHVVSEHSAFGDEVGTPLTTAQIFGDGRSYIKSHFGNVTISQSPAMIDDAPRSAITSPDIEATDGLVNIMSQVLWPQYLADGIVNQLFDDRSWKFAFTTMANLILHVGLEDKIDAEYDHGITMLVPPNRRFNRGEINIPLLLTNEMFDYTTEFVQCHLVKYIHHSQSIYAKEETQWLLISELKTHLWVATTENQIRFQSQKVLLEDQPARFGLYHAIDMPLLPPSIRDFTDFTWKSTDQNTADCFKIFTNSLVFSRALSEQMGTKLTMFCPSREAFSQFNKEDFKRLTEPMWRRHCTEFLMNMITEGYHTRAQLVSKAPSTIEMLNGAVYDLRRTGDAVRIKNGPQEQARSYFGDLIATDGYLHMTDRVITPTAVSRSVYDQTNDNPDYSLVTENIDYVDMQDMIDRDLPITFLAPYDRAWWRVRFGALEGAEIIKRHLFRGLLFCDVIANETSIEAVNGETHSVELRGDNDENLFIADAFVFECDILARNGVLHHIDRVIGLDYPTIPPTTSPEPTGTPQPSTSFQPSSNPAGPPPTPEFAPIYYDRGYIRPTLGPVLFTPGQFSGAAQMPLITTVLLMLSAALFY